MAARDLIPTGIPGLDDILLGGIPKGNVILVEGAAGTGKTLLGMEFLYRGITEYNEPGILVTFEVAPKKLIRDAANFGWDFEQLQRQNTFKIIFTSPPVLNHELRSPDSLLLETAAQMGARRIFIDGISLLRSVSNDVNNAGNGNNHGNEMGCYRQLLQMLLEGLQRESLTAILSHEVTAIEQQAFALEVAEFLTDTVMVLRREQNRRRSHRSLEITKSRGQDFESGRHTLRITAGKGLEVFRRVQARPRGLDLDTQPTSSNRQSIIGSAPLDELFGGGVFDGSVTMMVGISGAGKTVLGMQLLLEGVKNGKRGLMVSLDEHPEQVLRNADTLGLNLREHLDSGAIQFFYDCPRELELDVHLARIEQIVEEHHIERLIIDGMTSYQTALEDEQLYREFFHALVSFSKARLMTTFLSYENPELFGINKFMPDFPVSSIVDNIILINFVELGDTLRRAITVVKARGSANQFVTREFTIGSGGITLAPVDPTNALPALPFQNYYGLLSRAPTRLSPILLPGNGAKVVATE
ncbi:MAG TPA: ATPase domain-containing protein [Gemmataceae bacterium]|nr:ATPase domain-containing protein [Gemmataceae bacterium]